MRGDGVTDWCGLKGPHGPHGEKLGRCPGNDGKPASSNGEARTPVSSKKAVESSVRWLNGKLKEIGSQRWYEFLPGPTGSQQRHKLLEYVPEMVHPRSEEVIGRTYAEALKFVNAMNHALSGVIADRRAARNVVLHPDR